MKLARVALLLALTLTVVATAQETKLQPRDFFPLAEGLDWRYEVEYRSAKKVVDATEIRVRCRPVKRAKLRRGANFVLEMTSAQGRKKKEILQREYLAFDESGSLICTQRDSGPTEVPLEPAQILLKGPLKVGNRWKWVGRYKGREATSEAELVATEALKIGESRYDCIVVEVTTKAKGGQSQQLRRLWYGRGVGLVQEESKDRSGEIEATVFGRLLTFTDPRKSAPATGEK